MFKMAAVGLMALAGWGPAQEEVLVDEVVAIVNRDVITRSEVWQEALLVLVERQGSKGLGLQITPGFLGRVMELLINQRVLLHEAHRLGLRLETDLEREAWIERFKRKFKDLEDYTRFLFDHDLTEEAVVEMLGRHWRVARLKERKLRLMPEVSDEEVRRYYEKNRHELGEAPIKLVAESIRLKLLAQRGQSILSKWIQELRRRSQVTVLVDLTKQTASNSP